MAEVRRVKQRRSPAEIELAGKLQERSKKRTPDNAKFDKAKRYAEASVKSPRFEENFGQSSIDHLPVHYFRAKGEYVVGIIGEAQGESYGPSTYPFQVDIINGQAIDGDRVIRLPGNRRLARAIVKADCLYQRIKITYLGKLFAKAGGHYEKVYRIEAAPLSKEPMTPEGQRVLVEAAREAGMTPESQALSQWAGGRL